MEAKTARRRQMGEEFAVLLHQARAIPSFERFMLHETYTALAEAAAKGPVVVFVPGRLECHAIIVPNGQDQPQRVNLKITPERVQELGSLLQVVNHQLRNKRAIFVSRP